MIFVSLRWHLLLMFVFCLWSSVHMLYLEPAGSLTHSGSLSTAFVALLGAKETFCCSLMAFWGFGRFKSLSQDSGQHSMLPPLLSCCQAVVMGEQLSDFTSPGKQDLGSPVGWESSHPTLHHLSSPSRGSVAGLLPMDPLPSSSMGRLQQAQVGSCPPFRYSLQFVALLLASAVANLFFPWTLSLGSFQNVFWKI